MSAQPHQPSACVAPHGWEPCRSDEIFAIRVERSRELLAQRARMAFSPLERGIGLLNRERLDSDEALVIRSCSSIHTCFMRFPIDVVFIDRQWRVVATKRDLKPWRTAMVLWGAWSVIELPGGRLRNYPVSPGEHLSLTREQ